MDRCHGRTAATADPLSPRLRVQLDHQPAPRPTLLMAPTRNAIPHPASQLGNTMPIGHGRPQFVVLDTNNSAGSAVCLSLSWEKNPFFARAPATPAPAARHFLFRRVRQPWRLAKVAELVDALDLGSSGSHRGGSSPPFRTNPGRHAESTQPAARSRAAYNRPTAAFDSTTETHP